MNCIAIDTSGEHLSVIVIKDDKVYSFFDKNCGVNHSVILMDEVEKLVTKSGFLLESADFFASVVGPGSFTGIRIGVSTVKALCLSYNKPAVSITSFDTIAYNKKNGKVLALIDAHHGGLYACGYDNGKVSVSPSFIGCDELKIYKKEYEFLSATKIDKVKTKRADVLEGLRLALIDKSKEFISGKNLAPLYLRKSQAEEGRL